MGLIKGIIYYIKRNIARIIASAIIGFICAFFTQSCVNAQSITNNLRTINDSYITYFTNVAESSDYKNYVITSDYTNNGSYNNYTTYYLCLTNDDLNIKDSINMSSNCDLLYSYNNYSNNYNYNISKDDHIYLTNTIYYTNKKDYCYFYLVALLLSVFMIFTFLIFNRIFRNRYGGLKYERID